jgi:hypothetical protein
MKIPYISARDRWDGGTFQAASPPAREMRRAIPTVIFGLDLDNCDVPTESYLLREVQFESDALPDVKTYWVYVRAGLDPGTVDYYAVQAAIEAVPARAENTG